MPEQPQQWSERTLDMPPQDPWGEHPTVSQTQAGTEQHQEYQRTQRFRPDDGPPPADAAAGSEPQADGPQSPFSRGRAQVSPREQREHHTAVHEPTGTGWPGEQAPSRPGMSWRWRDLRRGNEWTGAAALFAFVCWGIWAISEGGGLGTPSVVFLVTLIVAVGVFCLARVAGYFVLERMLNRTRHSARGSHLIASLFLVGVGIGHLRMTGWVMTAWNWTAALFTS